MRQRQRATLALPFAAIHSKHTIWSLLCGLGQGATGNGADVKKGPLNPNAISVNHNLMVIFVGSQSAGGLTVKYAPTTDWGRAKASPHRPLPPCMGNKTV
jgi:hypothetical protein